MGLNQNLFPDGSGAIFSDCRRYRYALWRIWEPSLPPCLFLMLNPSTADEVKNDPTVERCERRARAMGYGALYVANIFALRSTDPAALYRDPDPVGPENDEYIVEGVRNSAMVICGWGAHGALRDRGLEVRNLILKAGGVPHALTINADGTPKHPLYVAYSKQPAEWRT